MNNPTYYGNALAVFIRAIEMPNAPWDNGCAFGASNSPGIGISTDVTNLEESDNWTLLDQFGAARDPQDGQYIGTTASGLFPGIGVVDNAESTGNGAYPGDAFLGRSHLESLATGWVAIPDA